MSDEGEEAEIDAIVDDITEDLARLKAVELETRGLDPGDHQATVLADEAVGIASRLLPKTRKERKLVEETSAD